MVGYVMAPQWGMSWLHSGLYHGPMMGYVLAFQWSILGWGMSWLHGGVCLILASH